MNNYTEVVMKTYVDDKRNRIYSEFIDLNMHLLDLLNEIENHENYTVEEWEDLSKLQENVFKTLIRLESEITSL